MTVRKVLIAGIGNIFLGDDGFGSEVLRRLAGRSLPAGVRAVDYGIRGMHLAYELLDGWEALILVDAIPDHGAPGTITVFEVTTESLDGTTLDPHSMDPAAVLASMESLGGTRPRTVIVGCQVQDTAEGIGLSPPVAAAVEPAVDAVAEALSHLLAAGQPAAVDPAAVGTGG